MYGDLQRKTPNIGEKAYWIEVGKLEDIVNGFIFTIFSGKVLEILSDALGHTRIAIITNIEYTRCGLNNKEYGKLPNFRKTIKCDELYYSLKDLNNMLIEVSRNFSENIHECIATLSGYKTKMYNYYESLSDITKEKDLLRTQTIKIDLAMIQE